MAEKATRYMSSEEILKEYRGAKNKKTANHNPCRSKPLHPWRDYKDFD